MTRGDLMNGSREVIIRDIQIKDLTDYLYWTHPGRKHHNYNGPYFKQKTEEEQRAYTEELKQKIVAGECNVQGNKKIIADKITDGIIGEVNWYWKSEETLWMEIGIVIFNENYWGCGIGYRALKLWIDKMFTWNNRIVRLGLTTWSGNLRMMSLAEKLGLKKEATYRKARIVDGKYYDSVSYGILREEWQISDTK